MVKLEKGSWMGFTRESYEWLKKRGVSHRLMRDILTNPRGVYEFYRARTALGKSFANIPKEYHEEVLEAIRVFMEEEEKRS